MNPYLVERKRGENYVGISCEYRLYLNKSQERYFTMMGNKLRGAYNLLVGHYVKDKDWKDIIRKNKETQKEVYDLLINTEWLKDVPTIFTSFIQQSFFTSLDNFRKHKRRPPNFKKKSNLLTISTDASIVSRDSVIDWKNKTFSIMRGELKKRGISSDFNVNFHNKIEGARLKRFVINKKSDGKWYISMSFDVTNVMERHEPVTSKETVGIDVGIKDMAITSDGNKFQVQIKKIKMLEDKISKIQKSISRKQLINKGNFNSGNYKRLLERKGRLQMGINNLRKQVHQYTTTVLTKGKYGTIQMEDIKLGFMMKNKHLSRSTQRIGINSFTVNLENVAKSKGITVNYVNPKNTSRTCCECGYINKDLKLSHREWVCPDCNTKHDRDINAAKNIKKSLDIRE